MNGQSHRTSSTQHRDQPVPGPPSASSPAGPPQQALPPLEVLAAEFEQLLADNQARFKELAAQGAGPDPLYLVHARINSLIDSIAQLAGPDGPWWAVMTRLQFERQIAAELAQAGPAVRRMQLAEGARYTPEMIRALARQTGQLPPARIKGRGFLSAVGQEPVGAPGDLGVRS